MLRISTLQISTFRFIERIGTIEYGTPYTDKSKYSVHYYIKDINKMKYRGECS